MRAAAAALLLGWDPIRFLDLDHIEAMVANEVLQLAEDMRVERKKAEIKAFEVAVQNGVAKAFSKS